MVLVVPTWQGSVVGHLPLEADGRGSAVHPALEAGRLAQTHRGAVGLDGDDGRLQACWGSRRSGTEHLGGPPDTPYGY